MSGTIPFLCLPSLFLTPQLAHYAAMVKKQGLGLRRTNVIVYFEHSTVSGRATLLREELSLAQEVESSTASPTAEPTAEPAATVAWGPVHAKGLLVQG